MGETEVGQGEQNASGGVWGGGEEAVHKDCAMLEKAAESGHSRQSEDVPSPPRSLPPPPPIQKKSMVLYIREEKVNR